MWCSVSAIRSCSYSGSRDVKMSLCDPHGGSYMGFLREQRALRQSVAEDVRERTGLRESYASSKNYRHSTSWHRFVHINNQRQCCLCFDENSSIRICVTSCKLDCCWNLALCDVMEAAELDIESRIIFRTNCHLKLFTPLHIAVLIGASCNLWEFLLSLSYI
jgi:hypothetical protein